MNDDQRAGQWRQLEGEAKKLWGKLTDDDWKLAEGDVDKLAGRIQERYGDAKETVKEKLGKLVRSITERADTATSK